NKQRGSLGNHLVQMWSVVACRCDRKDVIGVCVTTAIVLGQSHGPVILNKFGESGGKNRNRRETSAQRGFAGIIKVIVRGDGYIGYKRRDVHQAREVNCDVTGLRINAGDLK